MEWKLAEEYFEEEGEEKKHGLKLCFIIIIIIIILVVEATACNFICIRSASWINKINITMKQQTNEREWEKH